MAKLITDDGLVATAQRPLRLPTYHPRALPDAAGCTHALIVVNDSADPTKGRLAISNGQSWDRLARVDDAGSVVDITPIVRSAVSEMLPARIATARPLAAPTVEASPVSPQTSQDTQAIAQAMLEMTETINQLLNKTHDLEQRVAFLEANALARAQIVREAS